jgi:hypothetical protein
VEPINFAVRTFIEILFVGGILGSKKRHSEKYWNRNHLKSERTGVASQFMMLHRLHGLHYVAGETWAVSSYRSQYDPLGALALTDIILNTNDPGPGKREKSSEYVQYHHRDKRRKAPTQASGSRVSER